MYRKLLVFFSLLVPVLVITQTPKRGAQQPNPTPPATQPQNQPQTGEQQPTEEQMRAEAEEGIKHVLVSQAEAWNSGNLQGYMAGYWHAPDLTFFSGTAVTKGWEATLQRYQRNYKGQGKEMGQLEFQDLNIDLLSNRAAVVTGRWQLTMSDGKTPGGLFTLIFKRMQGGWRIVHDHTSGS